MKIQNLLTPLLLAVFLTFSIHSTRAVAADCGDAGEITVSEMSWASAGMLAHITRTILEDGYGCSVRIMPGDTVPSATTMLNRGQPDIAPELWVNLVPEIWEQIAEKGTYIAAADTYRDGVLEGLWIPDYVAEENPGLRSIEDLKDHWELFTEPASPDKGRLYACPPGWGCEITIPQYFKALGLEENYNLFSPGSGGAMKANIARRVEQGEPIVTYYWSPTDVVGKYNLVRLEMPPHEPEKWNCIANPDCPDPEVTGYKPGIVKLVVLRELEQQAPDVVAYLRKQSLPNDVVNALLAWGDENRASSEEMAEQFFAEYQDVWREWLPGDVASKLASSVLQ